VTERSITAIKRRALRRTRTLARDSESQTSHKPSWISALVTKAKAPFTRVYWENALEKTDAETLVDTHVLTYAYLEVGLIETVAVFVLLLLLKKVSLFTNDTHQTRRVLRRVLQGWFHSQ
jgi:sodium/potassium-transporting ATPase subunit alpha